MNVLAWGERVGEFRDVSSERKEELPMVGVVMGSDSDWATMRRAAEVLAEAGIPYEARVVSAHRTPRLLYDYAEQASSRGIRCIIAGAGGAAHLPGMLAAITALPVLGVPVCSRALGGLDSLLSIVQMPFGIPVATFSIGAEGAEQAGRFATKIIRLQRAMHGVDRSCGESTLSMQST